MEREKERASENQGSRRRSEACPVGRMGYSMSRRDDTPKIGKQSGMPGELARADLLPLRRNQAEFGTLPSHRPAGQNQSGEGAWLQVGTQVPGHDSVQFSSVTQLCPTLCDPMDCSTPDFPVHHKLPEFTQTHVHRVGDAIQTSHPLSSSSPPAFYLSHIRVISNKSVLHIR